MNIDYFRKINNDYKSSSKQESDLYLLNRHESEHLYENIDHEYVLKNNEPYELLIIKGTVDKNKNIKSVKSKPFNLGDYITWNNQIWIVNSIDSNNKAHNSGTMVLCTALLRWQKSNGEIVERWAYAEDFERYSKGETSNGVITVAENSYGMTIPIDNDTKLLNRNHRFVVDIIDGNDYLNGSIPDVYRISNRKTVLSNNIYFNRGGIMTLTMIFDTFNPATDKYINLGNGEYGWICGLRKEQSNVPNLTSNIIYSILGKDEVIGGFEHIWTADFTDKENKPVNVLNWNWKIIADFDIDCNFDNNQIKLHLNEKYIGKSFVLQISVDEKIMAEKNIKIIGF